MMKETFLNKDIKKIVIKTFLEKLVPLSLLSFSNPSRHPVFLLLLLRGVI
jgi:hypothetical protein